MRRASSACAASPPRPRGRRGGLGDGQARGRAVLRALVSARQCLRSRLALLAGARLRLALALHAGRLVVAAAARLAKNPVLLHLAREALEHCLERITVADLDTRHWQ